MLMLLSGRTLSLNKCDPGNPFRIFKILFGTIQGLELGTFWDKTPHWPNWEVYDTVFYFEIYIYCTFYGHPFTFTNFQEL